ASQAPGPLDLGGCQLPLALRTGDLVDEGLEAPDLLSAQRPYLLEGFTKLSQFARLQHQLVLELLHDQLELRLRVLAERMSLPAAVVFRFEQLYLGPELLDLRPLEVQVEGA